MKKLAVTILLMASVLSAGAQMFSLGVKTGYNVTLPTNTTIGEVGDAFSIKNGMQHGFHVGLYSRIGRRFYVQPEVNYSYFNYKSTTTYAGTRQFTISTVEIPILAGYSLVNTNFFNLRVMAGPKFSINAGSSKPTPDSEVIEVIRDARIGLDCGIGFDIWRIAIDVRYNLMPDLYKRQDKDTNDNIRNKVFNSFQVSFGFKLFGKNQ